ncbi:MAG: tRNA (adenosine(37)-N6)-threonylcarbamoyltransferase complex ATPase subunit type 1 TsaE [bacterium]
MLTASPAGTIAAGRRLGSRLRAGTYVALCGELGTGKTTFVRGVAEGAGAECPVLSPTFQIVREYAGAVTVFHLDFYRLESQAEVEALDIESCLERGAVVAEWADRFPRMLPEPFIEIRFYWENKNRRRIRIERWSASVADAVSAALPGGGRGERKRRGAGAGAGR